MNLQDVPAAAWVAIATVLSTGITGAVGIFAPKVTANAQREQADKQREADAQQALIERSVAYNGQMRDAYAEVLSQSADFRSTLESAVRTMQDGCSDEDADAAEERVVVALSRLSAACAHATLFSDTSKYRPILVEALGGVDAAGTVRRLREGAASARARAMVAQECDLEARLAVINEYAKTEAKAAEDFSNALRDHISGI